ncbi:MAG: hypothetical protein RIS47_1894, partial [Bacteroidota bacterium]
MSISGFAPFYRGRNNFFKGRDTHVRQIIHQLEEKHVVVVTGASGDGKSSLVYAGIVPNAKAGFFRAHYNNWLLADFRPERTPLNNLSNVLATCFEMDVELVKEELELGFSSLVDLYKSTPFYIDTQADSWKNASENEQKLRKSKAANLFILADQFEEFFTNSENFIQSNPSDESYTTVNLLLETARIAYEEKLPIYVVLTMRSDFISQCVAFKGLPETIGFSQFFIPRLKRHELQQVIEEPAILSGGTISKRLTEILINELHDGFDRLPVLQHALNRLWLEARNGEEVLDLMHLAKLGGLDSLYLSDTEQMQFKNWLSQ